MSKPQWSEPIEVEKTKWAIKKRKLKNRRSKRRM